MKKVIIIGASSGIGENLAKQYAKQGCVVAIAARREDRLNEIKRAFPNNIISYKIDVSKPFKSREDGVREEVLQIFKDLGGASLLIYCAGAGKRNHVLDLETEHNMVDVNVSGFLEVANAVVEYACNGGEITFATISSIASVKGIGVSAAYSSTKMFQVRYMEALGQLAHKNGWKLKTVTIKPGFIDTEFISGSNYPMVMSLDYAAKKIKKAIDKNKSVAIIDWRWSIVVFFWRLIPMFIWRKLKL